MSNEDSKELLSDANGGGEKLSGGHNFTTLDMTSGYYVALSRRQQEIYFLFEHNVMPFGLVNVPMYFQEMVLRLIAISNIETELLVTMAEGFGCFSNNAWFKLKSFCL